MRCAWAESNELFISYHDDEWGVPVYDDRLLLEMINLEGAQAGLSWLTILKKRATYKKAFDNFDAKLNAVYDEQKRAGLMQDDGIIRNRLKINAVIENAKAYLILNKEYKSFSDYLWEFVEGRPILNSYKNGGVELSIIISNDLKKRGFKFVGPTICYSFMQAIGILNDHQKNCFRFSEIRELTLL